MGASIGYVGAERVDMRIDGDTVKWRNGREEYANCGIIGIAKDSDGEYSLSGGYDDGIPSGEPLTQAEREELAAYMINQWALFGQKEVVN